MCRRSDRGWLSEVRHAAVTRMGKTWSVMRFPRIEIPCCRRDSSRFKVDGSLIMIRTRALTRIDVEGAERKGVSRSRLHGEIVFSISLGGKISWSLERTPTGSFWAPSGPHFPRTRVRIPRFIGQLLQARRVGPSNSAASCARFSFLVACKSACKSGPSTKFAAPDASILRLGPAQSCESHLHQSIWLMHCSSTTYAHSTQPSNDATNGRSGGPQSAAGSNGVGHLGGCPLGAWQRSEGETVGGNHFQWPTESSFDAVLPLISEKRANNSPLQVLC